jgi:hypothetical protein
MRSIFVFCLILTALPASAQIAQLKLLLGTSYYAGDLNPYGKPIHLKPSGSAYLSFAMSKRINVRAGYTYARVEGNDADSKYDALKQRNLYFKSDIHEVSGIVELNFLNYKPGDMDRYPYTPYLFAGVGLMRMNPKGRYRDDFIELQPLGTEGQGSGSGSRSKYQLNQLCIPFGFGFKVNMNRVSCLGFEFGVRKLFTDFLDDVSGYYVDPEVLAAQNGIVAAEMADQRDETSVVYTQRGAMRGNPVTKDWYMQAAATLSFIISNEKPCNNFGVKRY